MGKIMSKSEHRVAYREFGSIDNSAAMESSVPELPAQQQNIRVQTTRSGRKGKTVTLITGFQSQPETLTLLLKQLKNKCGTGGTVKENALEIQGDKRTEVGQILSDLGYKVKIS
jgi:translation initiation factor 1